MTTIFCSPYSCSNSKFHLRFHLPSSYLARVSYVVPYNRMRVAVLNWEKQNLGSMHRSIDLDSVSTISSFSRTTDCFHSRPNSIQTKINTNYQSIKCPLLCILLIFSSLYTVSAVLMHFTHVVEHAFHCMNIKKYSMSLKE